MELVSFSERTSTRGIGVMVNWQSTNSAFKVNDHWISPQPEVLMLTWVSDADRAYQIGAKCRQRYCLIYDRTTTGCMKMKDFRSLPIRRSSTSFYVREADKDHWEIIFHHLIIEANYNERMLISGTPGGGKSVEGRYKYIFCTDFSTISSPHLRQF